MKIQGNCFILYFIDHLKIIISWHLSSYVHISVQNNELSHMWPLDMSSRWFFCHLTWLGAYLCLNLTRSPRLIFTISPLELIIYNWKWYLETTDWVLMVFIATEFNYFEASSVIDLACILLKEKKILSSYWCSYSN